ncbi:cytochrome p450 [Pyrenophora seminiperda CCB06]|uniref:Cytochrome p450 n=1 Tax=Pyrenophora seminiperda CCB06 TaxID=1302712 RepID=A0A3M7MBL2_9PLEO|nr:cytochrome p450 [Pyrenophora seminiperda CCB06]
MTMRFLRLEYIPLFLGGVVGLVIVNFIVTSVYNVFFHPLSKYPGPRLASATGLVFYYYLITGSEVEWNRQCHERYGEVVRLGPDRLSYITAQAWKDINGFRAGGRLENPKDPSSTLIEGPNAARSLINILDHQHHGRVRKVFTNAFSDRALKLQEPLISLHINKLIQALQRMIKENPESPVNMVRMFNCTTFDIMGDLSFGEPLGMLDTGEYTPWVQSVFKGIKFGTYIRVAREYPWIQTLISMVESQALRDAHALHYNHSAERVNKRIERGDDPNKPDIWKLVLEKGGDMLSLKEMHSNSSLFMLAGTETTATLLSGATYYLLKNPAKMQKLVGEVRALSAEQLTLEELARLPYMAACLEEALRLYPPVPTPIYRQIAPGGNAVLGDWLPEGTRIAVAHHSAYRSPTNFKNPDAFEPERWLPNTGYDDDQKDVMQPFSVGPRNCLGKNLAYHEMRAILATLLWHFDLELCPESNDWLKQKVYGIFDKGELLVKLNPIRS